MQLYLLDAYNYYFCWYTCYYVIYPKCTIIIPTSPIRFILVMTLTLPCYDSRGTLPGLPAYPYCNSSNTPVVAPGLCPPCLPVYPAAIPDPSYRDWHTPAITPSLPVPSIPVCISIIQCMLDYVITVCNTSFIIDISLIVIAIIAR